MNFFKKLKGEKTITLISLLGMLYSFISSFLISSLITSGYGPIKILNLGRGYRGFPRALWFDFSLNKLFFLIICLIVFLKTKTNNYSVKKDESI